MSFAKLGVFEPLLKAIEELGYTKPTTIQTRAIPLVLAKKDLFATAQTGTGKTAAFALPLLQRLKKPQQNSGVRAVVLSPTRELSLQIYEDMKNYANEVFSIKDGIEEIIKIFLEGK